MAKLYRPEQSYQQQQIDRYELLFIQLQQTFLQRRQSELLTLKMQLANVTPLHRIRESRHQLSLQYQQLKNHMMLRLQQRQQQCGNLAAKLDALSPLATLQRGYAIASLNQQILRHANQVMIGDKITVQLLEGSLGCTVDKTQCDSCSR